MNSDKSSDPTQTGSNYNDTTKGDHKKDDHKKDQNNGHSDDKKTSPMEGNQKQGEKNAPKVG